MKRIYTPTKRCTDAKKHDDHDWKENKVFARYCPGRSTDKQENRATRRERIRREGRHP